MPAVIKYPERAAFLRVGPLCHAWGNPYRASLDVELIDDIAIIGGLDLTPTDEEYREVMELLRAEGLRAAMYRPKTGMDKLRFLPMPRRLR